MKRICIFLLAGALVACKENNPKQAAAEAAEVYSLLGLEYYAPTEPNARLDSNLAIAQKNFEADPSEENYIWLGRRLAYKVKYNQAIEVFTNGIEQYPNSYKLYRHRGHRYLSQRKFDAAIEDFEKAAERMPAAPIEIEPDGVPNKINQPLSSTQFNVWYHLGLAHYLKGEFDKAEQAYLKCMEVSDNDDLITATVDWLYMTYRRQGKTEEATKLLEKITPDMTIVENDSYYKRLKLYQGVLPVDSVLNVNSTNSDVDLALATQGYGVGNWYLYNGDTAQAISVFERVVGGKHFSAFGFIAAEADLARLR
ncbi:MAG: tetratricopeptide repeat protein [Cyclobacteriaceae bacterium]|nr:MAG: tetratricopeptide repeat protein [Cyclobacteriaceae bacterium]